MKRVAVTGGSGQISYSLLFQIAAGHLYGPQEPIALYIRDLPEALKMLEGVAMELEDCAFPLLKEIHIGVDPFKMFAEADCAFLIGSKPRGPGMERKDLLLDNGKIFVGEGHALNEAASRNVKVLVVGNPCNTNCLIAMRNAPNLPAHNFHAMVRLDQNRGRATLAKKAEVPVSEVTHLTIWGNHSSTQVPDFTNARIKGKKVEEVIADRQWLQNEFFTKVQKRGAAVIEARGKSSAASAASAALDAMRDLVHPSPENYFYSSATTTLNNPYGIEEGLIFGFPCRTNTQGETVIIPGFQWDMFIKEKIAITQKELLEERECVKHLFAKGS